MAAGRRCSCGNKIHEKSKGRLCSNCELLLEAMQQQSEIDGYQQRDSYPKATPVMRKIA